ncbi:MAG: hypothetical protein M3O30_00175 [Planctomycetota bacterium]|nr:hypothetical protein [Planctomycetota bacterium]
MVWAYLWPQSGDGDAATHFLFARQGLWNPSIMMGSWGRVGQKLPLLIPAQFGILAARWTSAFISVLCAWQTIGLAKDLGLARPLLAAPLLLFQPLVFNLASDTMTELPFALGLVVAIRLWWQRRWLISCLAISYLPLVRPEGFFLCAMWGLMVLGTNRIGSWHKRILLTASLSTGIILWATACAIICHDPTYFFHRGWSWPADSTTIYGHGSVFSYINHWPLYCGPIILPLWFLGLQRLGRQRILCASLVVILASQFFVSQAFCDEILCWPTLALIGALAWSRRREKITIAWWAFWLIFTVHTVLWWRGWFGSDGLIRILACVAPITAVICLGGWNVAWDWLNKMRCPDLLRWSINSAILAALLITAVIYYTQDPTHYRIFGERALCDFMRSRDILAGAPMLALRDPIAQIELNLAPGEGNFIPFRLDRAAECAELLHAPIGTAGIWDDQHTGEAFNVNLQDLPRLGFTVLREFRQTIGSHTLPLLIWRRHAIEQVFVVIRKDRLGELPVDLRSNLMK